MDLTPEMPQPKMPRRFLKIIVILLLIIQGMGALIVQNVYSRFVKLEEENRLYDNELDELKAQIQIIQFRLQESNK